MDPKRRLNARLLAIGLVFALVATGVGLFAAGSASEAQAADDEPRVLVTRGGTRAYLVLDGERYRADADCRSQLIEAFGRDPEVVRWSVIAAIPTAPGEPCASLLIRLADALGQEPRVLVTRGGTRAYLVLDGLRYRAEADCRPRLIEAFGRDAEVVRWSVIAAIPTAPSESCDSLLARLGDGGGPATVVYSNDFSLPSDADRLDSFVAYRDPFVVNHETGRSDHRPTGGVDCTGPDQTRPQTRDNPWGHIYLCHPGGDPALGHMMAYAMDTSGYGFTGSLPDQVFEGVRSVAVDVNTTSAGGRNFVEIKVLPAADTYIDAMPCGPDLPCNDGWDYDDLGAVGASTDSQEGTGLTINTAAEPDGYFFHHYERSVDDNGVHYAECTGPGFCFRARVYDANPDVRARHRHVLRDNGDGTLSFGITEADGVVHWVTAPGSFPTGPVRVVVAFHNYTGTKDGNGPGYEGNESASQGGFTWHWDDLTVVAESATPSDEFFAGNSADRIVVPDGCIAFVQGQRNLPGDKDIDAQFQCEGDRLPD